MVRQTRVVMTFDSVDDASAFVTEAKSKNMIPPKMGLRRQQARDTASLGVVLDQLIVSAVPVADRPWIVPTGEVAA